jgi:hypothetical protein
MTSSTIAPRLYSGATIAATKSHQKGALHIAQSGHVQCLQLPVSFKNCSNSPRSSIIGPTCPSDMSGLTR